jgi:hypothetical protein
MDILLFIYLVIILVANLVWWLAALDWSMTIGLCFCNPRWIYNHTKTNWFGTICLAVLANAAFGPSTLCYWFYKLCTVGRRQDE